MMFRVPERSPKAPPKSPSSANPSKRKLAGPPISEVSRTAVKVEGSTGRVPS